MEEIKNFNPEFQWGTDECFNRLKAIVDREARTKPLDLRVEELANHPRVVSFRDIEFILPKERPYTGYFESGRVLKKLKTLGKISPGMDGNIMDHIRVCFEKLAGKIPQNENFLDAVRKISEQES